MTSIFSVNVATAAAKVAPPTSGVASGPQVASPSAVAQATQAAANGVAAQVELSSKKVIQQPNRTEGTFDPQKEKERSDAGADSEELDAESPYRSLGTPVDVVA